MRGRRLSPPAALAICCASAIRIGRKLFELDDSQDRTAARSLAGNRRANGRGWQRPAAARCADVANVTAESLRDASIESLAICLLHAWKNPQHELLLEQTGPRGRLSRDQRVASRLAADEDRVARRYDGRRCVSQSGAARATSQQLRDSLPGSDLRLLTSAGGLVRRRTSSARTAFSPDRPAA